MTNLKILHEKSLLFLFHGKLPITVSLVLRSQRRALLALSKEAEYIVIISVVYSLF